jgi:DNA replication and repair protein RecF
MTDGEIQVGDNPANIKKTQRKKLLVNGVAKRLVDFAGNLKVVLFGPWDLDLVTESPSLRRKFMDSVLSQVDREYRRSVMIYEKGLRQRNRLLLRIRDEGVSRGQLMYWDRLLIKHGQFLTKKREEFIDYINLTPDFLDRDYSLTYDNSAISEGRLAQYEEEEVSAATTLVGPHRDDMIFKLKTQKSLLRSSFGGQAKVKMTIQNSKLGNEEKELARYGSRGEARMGVLWLKLAELSYIKSVTDEVPVLLLDDIFSELDHEHRDVVMEVCRNQQTIITTADVHNIKGIKGAEIVRL